MLLPITTYPCPMDRVILGRWPVPGGGEVMGLVMMTGRGWFAPDEPDVPLAAPSHWAPRPPVQGEAEGVQRAGVGRHRVTPEEVMQVYSVRLDGCTVYEARQFSPKRHLSEGIRNAVYRAAQRGR